VRMGASLGSLRGDEGTSRLDSKDPLDDGTKWGPHAPTR
jgi:hypothetical protein